ncbi:M14 family zinc carboxypeptidase [Streptomyces sp. NRRL F-5126]|uniref:M14 family zinc carboxypeptidase n=1 Tax=Streptomyces sp. NRRL F-5126 TaxID=1463857 RepID=UPI00131B9C71|nr:M14 family zinc carboxypeptidase [Streptomyces sp. NRRL F-5126]
MRGGPAVHLRTTDRSAVPPRYPTVGELTARAGALAAAHPGRATVRRIGSSRGGEPLTLLTVGGGGDRDVLVVAGPHANEPVGGATALRIAEHLVSRERDDGPGAATWHLLLCLDPDGARRNERWLNGPMTFDHHFRRMFRPNFYEQPEWLHARSEAELLPETRALIDLQDEVRPFLQCSLHGVDVGGSFVQLTRDLPGIARPLARSAARLGIPVELSPFDAFFWPSPGTGVFDMPPPSRRDQFAVALSSSHASTWYHPYAYGTVTAIVEAPMWAADEIADPSPHPDPCGAMALASRTTERDAAFLADTAERVRPRIPDHGMPLLLTVDEFLRSCPSLVDEWRPESFAAFPGGLGGFNRAQVLALTIAARRLVLRTAGMLYQAVEACGPGARDVRERLDRFLTARCAAFEERCRPRWIPVEDQVEHQFRVVCAAFELAAGGAHSDGAAAVPA